MICQICRSENLLNIIQHDHCPLSNRYVLENATADAYTFQFNIAQCQNCALIQLTGMPNPAELAPRFDWITYREPEAHLDHVADRIAKLPSINKNTFIQGITYKDDSLLDRLQRKINCKTHRIHPTLDLDLPKNNVGSEVILPNFTIEKAKKISGEQGLSDIVIARHVLEHAFDVPLFLSILENLVKPNGYVVIELPDCRRSLTAFDYSMPWEEHTLYCTPTTFQNSFCNTPFSLVDFYLHPYAIENVMVAIVRFDQQKQKTCVIEKTEFDMARQYHTNFLKIKTQLHQFLSEKINAGEKIALFGAGHISSMFINLMDIKSFITCVIDDDQNKINLRMPGSLLPIYPSQNLYDKNIKFCLSGLSPESEKIVQKRHPRYFENGGEWVSISAVSSLLMKSCV